MTDKDNAQTKFEIKEKVEFNRTDVLIRHYITISPASLY